MSGRVQGRNKSKSRRRKPKQDDTFQREQQPVEVEDNTAEATPSAAQTQELDDPYEKETTHEDPMRVDLSEQGLAVFPLYLLERFDVVHINVSNNYIHSIPTDVKKLVSLTHLDISQNPIHSLHPNDFSGIPFELSFLQRLSVIRISQCNLRYIPPAIWKCRRLCELDISRNKINVLSPDVGNLTKLCRLNIQYTSITTIPAEIAYCQELEEILMWGNTIENLPDVLRYLPNLQLLAINFRSFTSGIDNYMEGLLKTGQIKSEHLPAVIFEMPSLIQLDLEATKLNQLPHECKSKLQKLVLANNFFQNIPKLVFTLDQLTVLDLSGNMITSVPNEIELLSNLKSFWVNRNEIETLPDSFGSLIHMEELSLSHNKLKTFPEPIGNLKVLHTLIADHNNITSLPNSIGDLEELETLDLTANLLKSLPESMIYMKKLNSAHEYHKFRKYGLWLHKNPLSTPPQTVWKTKDTAKIYTYLKTRQVETLKHSQRQKLIVLGDSQSGKTSFIRSLTTGRSCLTKVPGAEQTRLVEFSSWRTKHNLKVLIQDTAGNEFFRTVLCPYFLDETALFLIVFNANTISNSSYQEKIGCYIDMLLLYCPRAIVKIVGTHMDLFEEDDQEICQNTWECIQTQLKMHIKKQQNEIKKLDEDIKNEEQRNSIDIRRKLRTQRIKLEKAVDGSLQLHGVISLVSLSEHFQGMQELVTELENTFLDSKLFPTVRQIVNKTWTDFSQAIKVYPGYYIEWQNITKLAHEHEIANKELPACLTYLRQNGKILWHGHGKLSSNIVVHHPRKLVEIMQALFRPDMPGYLDFENNRIFMSLGRFNKEAFATARENLLVHGHVSKALLQCMCLRFPQMKDKIDVAKFTYLMQHFNLCYLVPQPEIPSHKDKVLPFLVIPSYCQINKEAETNECWLWLPRVNELELETQYKFPTIQSVILFSRLSCQIHPVLEQHNEWSNEIVGKLKNMLLRITRDENETIEIRIRGTNNSEMQTEMDKIESIMESIILWFPGLTYRLERRVNS